MPYKDIEKARAAKRKWAQENRQKLKVGVEPSPNNFVEPKPTKQKVEPVEPCQTFSDVEPELVEPNKNSEPQPKAENANSKIIEGKEYVFIEGRWEPKIWSFEIMLEGLGAYPNHFNQEWIAQEKQRCREYWGRNCPNYNPV